MDAGYFVEELQAHGPRSRRFLTLHSVW